MKKIKNIIIWSKSKQFFVWLNTNLLFVSSTFLLAFIPLFPKIPILDILPGYIVRVRAEDFFIFLTLLVWLRDAYQKKFSWNTPYFWIVLTYLFAGFTTILISATLLQSIPFELIHIGKSALHYFRYIEYFTLFFFLYSAVKTKQHLKIIVVTLLITLLGIVGYGFGQKYMHFPLYSTMNREYSKGEKLYLQENARPQSTFAGHYDLAAYLVIVLPLIFAISLMPLKKLKKQKALTSKAVAFKLILHLTHALGAWMLITSGSKTALFAYFVGLLAVIYLNLRKLKNFRQKLRWGGIALVILLIGFTLLITLFGAQTESALLSIAQRNETANKIISKIPGISISPETSDPTVPEDLFGEGHEFYIKTTINEDGTETKEIIPQKSVWSANALKYGISMAIRLDELWPQALKGLANNPLSGSGYAALSQLENGVFSEADGTDNNFLRTLGETGFLGFITFYGFILIILIEANKNIKKSDLLISALNIGFVGSIIGLLINATYIDVFAASKVAFTFWAFAGIIIKAGSISTKANLKSENSKALSSNPSKTHHATFNIIKHFKKHFTFYLAFLLLFLTLHKNPYATNSLLKNFDTTPEAIENVVTAKCYLKINAFSVCRDNGLVLKNNPNFYSFLLVPFYKIYSDPGTYYYLNISLAILIILIVYLIISKIIASEKKSSHQNSLKFFSLMISFLIFNLFSVTSQPLTNSIFLEIILLALTLPIIYSYILIKFKENNRVFAHLILLVAILGTIFQMNLIANIKTNFRNNKPAYQNWLVKRFNAQFDNKYFANPNKQYYLITLINPFSYDLYKTPSYDLLPLSPEQTYFDQTQNVWADLATDSQGLNLETSYKNILSNDSELYITDYGIENNSTFQNNFENFKKSFDIFYEVIDCDDQCNLFKVSSLAERVSKTPPSINNNTLDPSKLSNGYSFSVLNNRYAPIKNPQNDPAKLPYTTKSFIKNLNNAGLNKSTNDFLILTGDPIHVTEASWMAYFDQNFGNLVDYPILYNAGNYDLLNTKLYKSSYHNFFTQKDYFIFLDLDENSQADANQKLFLYNSFLEIEKLPDIKNIFVIATNLNWQNTEEESNFVHELEKKFAEFPNINKYIVTSNRELVLNQNDETEITRESKYQYKYDQDKKTHYFANLSDNDSFVSYIKFDVDDDSNVSFENLK
ncbi:MAG: O-antigen ligase family protein [Pseudomonadales bacterium]|nr:O-antigen ligase family protein [Pseudomonadales bacterium]